MKVSESLKSIMTHKAFFDMKFVRDRHTCQLLQRIRSKPSPVTPPCQFKGKQIGPLVDLGLGQIHFPEKTISLQVDANYKVLFDKQHLQQILTNLLDNALHHNLVGDNKQKPLPVIIKVYKEGSVFLDIINSGNKISLEDSKHLFEPFFTTESSGTGLGLFMAKELANSNHASLNYIPLEDKTCFRIQIGA